MSLYSKLDTLLPQETVHLIPELNVLTLELFDILRTSPTPEAILYGIKVAAQPHWMRKLTAFSVLKNFKSEQLKYQAQIDLKNEKREVRDAAANCLSNQDLSPISYEENSNFIVNEGMSVLCGYVLEKSYQQWAVDYLTASLSYKNITESDSFYVHWYTARAFARGVYGQKGDFSKCIEKVEILLESKDQKVRKAASEAVGLLIALYNFDENVQKLLEKVQISSDFNFKTHGILQAISVAVQIYTQTHDFYILRKPQIPQQSTICAILKIYLKLPLEMNIPSQSASYQNAIILALKPTCSLILPLLNFPSPQAIDAGITATVYMIKYFNLDIQAIYLSLYLLTFHSAKPISVLAQKAINMKNTSFLPPEEEIIDFILEKLQNNNPDSRECGVRMIENFMKKTTFSLQNYQKIKSGLISCADNQSGGNLSQMPRKAAFEAFEQLIGKIDLNDVQEKYFPLFRERGSFTPHLARFLALNSPQGLASVIINAFDAVCADISDSCRACAGLANYDLQGELLQEIQFYVENDVLALNGIARLVFSLQKAGFPVEKLVEKLPEILEKAQDDWFDEIFVVHDGYYQAVIGNLIEPGCVEGLIAEDVEFDENAHGTASLLLKGAQNCENWLLKAIFNGDFDEQQLADFLLNGQVQPEIKQILTGSLVGRGGILPQKSGIDPKVNELVVKK